MQRISRLAITGKSLGRIQFDGTLCRLLLRDVCPKMVACTFLSNKTQRRSYSSVVNVETARRYVPRRTLMYIPGHDMKKLRKTPDLGVDCAVLECEDGVALNRKVYLWLWRSSELDKGSDSLSPVSYTHLTLPTKLSV